MRPAAGGLAALALPLLLPSLAAASAAGLVPAQMAPPAPAWVIKLLLLLTFFIHIVLVNIVLGSVMLAAAGAWRAPAPGGFGLKKETSFVPTLLALAVNFGVAPFLFAQVAYGGFLYSSGVLMGLWWISVPFLAMFAYYGLYTIKYAEPESAGQKRFLSGGVALLLMLVAFILCANSNMAVNPEQWTAWAKRPGGTLLGLGQPSLVPRYLHIIMASLAVGGLFMALRARWSLRKTDADRSEAGERMRRGLKIFVWASLAQAAVGLWYLLSLPGELRGLFLGGGALESAALGLALLGLGGALLAARAGRPYLCVGLILVTILMMVCIRDLLRLAMLPAPVPELPLAVTHGQGAALGFFLLCAALGLGLAGWLLRLAYRTFYREGAN